MAIITERGRWANNTVDERGRRIFANGLDERGRKVFGLTVGGVTTYSGSGTAQGSSSLTQSDKLILATSGTATGSSSLTSSEIKIYSANGSAQGTSTVSSSEHV